MVLDTIFLAIGGVTGILSSVEEADIYLTVILKFVSIVSFTIVITMNFPKAIISIKKFFNNNK